jgi:hypothetical protein
MSWGVVNASADTPAKLEAAVKSSAKGYFDGLDFDELADKGGRNQAKAAAKAARTLVEELGFEGNVSVTVSGHVRVGEAGAVPSGVTISVSELEIP